MAILHIFNPEHDIALAINLSNFTSPHAGRQLRADLGFLPAIWAHEDDVVLVDNKEDAQTAFARLMHRTFDGFVEKRELTRLSIHQVEPWGWDLALCAFLLRYGIDASVLPTEMQISAIRNLSHRKTAVEIARQKGFPSEICEKTEYVFSQLSEWENIVVKAPWSSSGRGIRFINGQIDACLQRWIDNVIVRQGSIIVEPYYNKVKDFAMEFESNGRGKVTCCGLSLFQTTSGAYLGNILATEEEKREMISRYVSLDLIDTIQRELCDLLTAVLKDQYRGPLGVDMMIVAREDKDGFLLHPCVEVNLRRTMGHVALELSKLFPSEHVMNIEYRDNHYKLKIHRL